MITRRGSIFLYAIMISFFAVIVGYIITIKIGVLMENIDMQNYDAKLSSNIAGKANIAISYDALLNSDGGGSPYDNDDFFYTNSTGTTDNDDLARKTLYGYVKKGSDWQNILLINTPTRTYIQNNTHNTGSNSVMAGNTQTGYLKLDIDNPYTLKIVEFDTGAFNSVKELRTITGSSASFGVGDIGWVMPDLSLSNSTGSARIFDFKNKDYALFLSFSGNPGNTGIEYLKYKITMENEHGSGVYITPLNDSESGVLKYLGTDIIRDLEGNYRYKQLEVVR